MLFTVACLPQKIIFIQGSALGPRSRQPPIKVLLFRWREPIGKFNYITKNNISISCREVPKSRHIFKYLREFK